MDESFGYWIFQRYFRILQAPGACTAFVPAPGQLKEYKGKRWFLLVADLFDRTVFGLGAPFEVDACCPDDG